MEEVCEIVELIEKHGAFSAVSFRRNTDTGKVAEGRVDRETWAF